MYIKFLTSIFLLLSSQCLYAEVFLSLSSENYAEALSVYDVVRDDPSSVDDGQLIYTHNRLEIGFRWQGMGLSYLKRFDGSAVHSADVALIYFLVENRARQIDERRYHYNADVNSLAAEGLSLSYQWDWNDDLRLSSSLDVGTTEKLFDGRIQGIIDYNETAPTAVASANYVYERDVLFKRSVKPAVGEFYALHVDIQYSSHIGMHRFKALDLLHRAQWSKAPFTTVGINSQRIQGRDDNGRLIIRPLGGGEEGFRDHVQKLKQRYYAENSIDLPSGDALVANLSYVAGQYWPQLGYQFNWKASSFAAIYGSRDKSMTLLNKMNQRFTMHMTMDHIDYKKAHRFNLGFSLSI